MGYIPYKKNKTSIVNFRKIHQSKSSSMKPLVMLSVMMTVMMTLFGNEMYANMGNETRADMRH